MIKLSTVNKKIKDKGIHGELCKGEGYFYFIGEDIDDSKGGVYVYRLNHLTLDQWLKECEERLKNS